MRFSLLALLIFTTLIGGCLAWIMGPSRARGALPWNASEINEHYDGIASDFIRLLRAKINEDDFDAYADELGLTEYNSITPHPNLCWPGCPEPWWDPPSSMQSVRYEPIEREDYSVMAAYNDGYVYFAVTSW